MSLRRLVLLLPVFIALFVLLNIPLSEASGARPPQNDTQRIQNQLPKMKANLNVAISNHRKASSQLQYVDLKISANELKLIQTQSDLNGIKKDLDAIITTEDNLGLPCILSVLTFSRDLGDFTSRVTATYFVVNNYIKTARQLHSQRDMLMQENLQLAILRHEKEVDLKVAELQHIEVDRALKLQNASLALAITAQQEAAKKRAAKVKRVTSGEKVATASIATSWSQSYVSRGASRSGFMFPVAGRHSYADTWGARRSGGRRHKGTDIMASRGTPVVACVSGVISKTSPQSSGIGGITIWLKGDDGNDYYFAHLNKIAGGISKGTRVSKGQVIAFVGSTGNAPESAPHLHFEVHRGGGSATDPYPVLKSTGE